MPATTFAQTNTQSTETIWHRRVLTPAQPPPATSQPSIPVEKTYYNHPKTTSFWQEIIQETLHAPPPNPSKTVLQRIPPTPSTPDQIRELFLALEPLSQKDLQTLRDRQPQASSLIPFLHLMLGDRAAAAGEEKNAQSHWQKASLAPVVNTEAMKRIANDSTAKEPLIAGLMIPMSGPSVAMGNNLIMAARKALADYRDVNLHLEVADSGGSAETAQAAVKELIGRGSSLLIGPIFHPEAIAAAKEAAANNIPILTLNPRQEILAAGGTTFLNAFPPDPQARVMARYAVTDAGLKRIAILAADTEYGQLMGRIFAEEVTALGGTITQSVLFPEQETDFSAALKMLVHLSPDAVKSRLAAARTSAVLDPLDQPPPRKEKDLQPLVDFDALFLPTTAKQLRLIAPQATLFNIHAANTTFLGASMWNRPELLEESELLAGATFCDIDQTLRDQFNATYQTILGVAPIPALSMLTYDSIAIVAQLLRDQRLGGYAWQQGLTRESGFYGSAGPVRFLPDGNSERYYHLYKIAEKKIDLLPAPPQNGTPDPSRTANQESAPIKNTPLDELPSLEDYNKSIPVNSQ